MSAGPRSAYRLPPPETAGSGLRVRLDLAYDGSSYAGWQLQPDRATVQGKLEETLARLTGEAPRVYASGRTDAGVHARGQVAHFDLVRAWRPDRLALALNACLPPDIRVFRARRVSAGFHARFSAKGKEYRYHIWNAPVLDPCLRFYRTHIPRPLDRAAMQQAASALEGCHDFAAFSANPNREVDGTVRTLQALRVRGRGPEVFIAARGDGFLYRMVRSLAGYLVRVGLGEVDPSTATEILESRTRTARVPTAPAKGLFLWRVFFRRIGHS